jgi:hypothetical protein
MLAIRGKVTGEKDILRMYAAYPQTILRFLIAWMRDERAGMVGGPDSKHRVRRGYRDILASRRRRHRGGTWSRSVAHQFKGYIAGRSALQGLRLTMGAGLRHPHKITRALELLETGGTIRSGKYMPIPIYRNLAKIGKSTRGGAGSLFVRMGIFNRFAVLKRGNEMLYFDRYQRRRRGRGRYPRSALLFIGRKEITVPRMLTGRYDFYQRWERRLNPALHRGQGVLDRSVRAAMTNPNYGKSGPT